VLHFYNFIGAASQCPYTRDKLGQAST